MTLEEIGQLIVAEKKKLTPYLPDPARESMKAFVKDNKDKIYGMDIINSSFHDWYIIIYYLYSKKELLKKYTDDERESKEEEINELLKELQDKAILFYCNTVDAVSKLEADEIDYLKRIATFGNETNGLIEYLLECFSDDKRISQRAMKKINKLSWIFIDADENSVEIGLAAFVSRMKQKNCNPTPFIDYFKKNPTATTKALEIAKVVRIMYNEHIGFCKNESEKMASISEAITSVASGEFQDKIDRKNKKLTREYAQFYTDFFDLIINEIAEDECRERETNTRNERLQKAYDRILRQLTPECESDKKKLEGVIDIDTARAMVKGLPDDSKVKIAILQWIIEHNKQINKPIAEEYDKIHNQADTLYRQVLSKYNLPAMDEDISVIRRNSVKDIEEIIGYLNRWRASTEEIMSILKVTNLATAKKVDRICNCFRLDPEFISKNKDLYCIGSRKLGFIELSSNRIEEWIKNSNITINPSIFGLCPEGLLDTSYTFLNNLETIDLYNLQYPLKSATDENSPSRDENEKPLKDLHFLLDKNLAEKIDMFIEMGLGTTLNLHIGLLNLSDLEMKRLKALYMVNGYTLMDEDERLLIQYEELMNIIKANTFFIPDDEIDDYLLDYSTFEPGIEFDCSFEDLLKSIFNDRYICNNKYVPRDIEIAGTTFSGNKVRRKLKEGKSLYDALFEGKICGIEEYKRVMEVLKSYQKKYE